MCHIFNILSTNNNMCGVYTNLSRLIQSMYLIKCVTSINVKPILCNIFNMKNQCLAALFSFNFKKL